jgi:hypothetical protein
MTTGTLIEIKTGQPEPWHFVQVAMYAWLIGKNWKWDPANPKKGKLITERPGFQRIEIPNNKGEIVGHRYLHKKAKRIYSVTEVCRHLRNWEYFDRSAADEGTWIHRAIKFVDEGTFTYTEEDIPSLWGKIEAYKKFLKENHSFVNLDINEIPLCAPLGNKGTYIAGTFDKYIPGGWLIGIILLYLRADATYKIIPVDKNKLSRYMIDFRHALACCEFTK